MKHELRIGEIIREDEILCELKAAGLDPATLSDETIREFCIYARYHIEAAIHEQLLPNAAYIFASRSRRFNSG